MSIVAADLIAHGSASRPEDDSATSGGAIDLTHRPELTQLTANSVIAAVSDGADVRTLTVTGRDATGAIDTEALILTGAVEVVGAKTFERILKLELSAPDASRTVTVTQGSAGPTRATITPNETDRSGMFLKSASEASPVERYEKFFWKNTHATLTLNDAEVELTADPAAKIKIALATAKDDTVSTSNRKTSPGLTFSDDGVALAVPGSSLAAAEAIGVWVEQSLIADDAAQKTTFTTQLSGTTV